MPSIPVEQRSPYVDLRVFNLVDCQFTILEACGHLRISRSFLYQLISEKRIKHVKLGSRTLIPGAEIQRFMKSIAA
jgi:excisionase family DNA binding protein